MLQYPLVLVYCQELPEVGVRSDQVWSGLSETTNLAPGSLATLTVSLKGWETKVEFIISFGWRAGPLQRSLSVPIGKLASNAGRNKFTGFLWRSGLMDGQRRRSVRHFWVPNKALHATAAAPAS